MSWKTVLVHVDESAHASERIKMAATIAMAAGAHLIGTATTGASRYLAQTRMLADLDPHLKEHLAFLRQRAERGLAEFEATARKLGLPSFEQRLVDDEAGGGICLQARYADLVVIGQHDPDEPSPVVMPDFPQYVVLHSGRPVLVVPRAGRFDTLSRRVLIGWDASMPATHAISNAIPLLRRAQAIEAVIFNPRAPPRADGVQPGADLVRYLARHEVQVELREMETRQDIGHALLARAQESNADLLVLGGYGHTRFREILLGGVTRTVLDAMQLPVLMSH
jgi:nucleotide-binding universal stress UspA family protein